MSAASGSGEVSKMAARKKKVSREEEMAFFEHLEELRKRLIFVALAIFAASILSFLFVETIIDFMTRPAREMELIYTTPAEAFMSQIRLAFTVGVVVTLPFTFFQIMSFIMPALREHEKKALIPLLVLMVFLFALGISFGYFIVFPFALVFFLGFATDQLLAYFKISEYISFVVGFLVAFGVVFQVPLVFWFLGYLSILSSQTLRRNRKFAVLIVAILSAVITPPDLFSQILMIGPMMVLYEVGILLVRLTEKKRAKLEQASEM